MSNPKVVRHLDAKKDQFQHHKKHENLLVPEELYLSAIGALIYLTINTRPDKSFVVNLLARYSSCPARRYWNRVKHIF